MADSFGGGMVALLPSAADRDRLALSEGEAPEELHLTLTYLGPDSEQLAQEDKAALLAAARQVAADTKPIVARAFGHATFNPDGHDDRDPCAVYLIGDTDALDPLRATFDPFASAEQHRPYIPHITAGYDLAASDLTYTGPVTFDTVRVALGPEQTDIPLTGQEEPVGDVETKGALSFIEARDPFTAGVLLGLAGLEPDAALELKAGPPGHTFPSPDPGATKLREYWTKGAGAAKIKWGAPGDFKRCVKQMRKHVGVRAEGLCNIYHRSALGVAPGQEGKSLLGSEELWVPDADAAGGWRAYAPAWQLPESVGEVKSSASVLDTDDDVMSALDRYAELDVVPQEDVSVEEIYEQALEADIAWELQPDGTLTDDDSDGTRFRSLFDED